ncbi:ComEC/Rec2 family competence protein [Azorhizobium doebereinerae]|uniref:ComEC/Rec2 family competence protein n=1 Tax=Azorhizobium doebereinerae TaxID=281091 RepID=UPI00041355B1|nr:ComEC/Rec2 family competence protein [Azorhizobium doebereinerae]
MERGRDRGGQRPLGAIAGVLGGAVARPVFVPAPFWPGALLGRLRDRILADARAEAASGRLILWLPVLFGCGILIYFGAAQEPSLPAAMGLAGALTLAAFVARTRPVTFALLLGAAAISAGFALATLQTARISHPVLPPPPGPVRLTGFIEQVERRPKADRVLLRVTAAEGRGLSERPALVRLSLGRGTAPPTGTPVSVLARLLPPVEAVVPGGHDFGRAIWFRGIDAVGFGLGRPRIISPPGDPPFSVRLGSLIEDVRRTVGTRIRQSLSGTAADIAVALVVGDRASVAPEVEESMRVSGLTHVLSISGLHMAMVAGTLFFLVRGLLAAIPPLALGFPIKTAAALVALGGSGIYLLLSGNDWPAQRSFFMLGIVLIGVMAGRSALTLRTVAVAAMLVLALGPQAILEAGTQMSFAATLALVAAYEHWSGLRARPAKGALVWQLAARAGLFLAALSLTSIVAGAATAPYAALHFQRVGVFGLLANLCAMPAVEFLVMPFGLMGVLLMPFGWDFIAWPVMGWGLDIMVRVSDMVAALPGADTRTDWVGPGAAGAATIALLCLCLLRGWLAALAIPPAVAAVLLLGPALRPDVLIAPNGQTVAVRGSDGRLSVTGARSSRLAVEQWLSREADPRTSETKDLAAGFSCDADACRAPLPGGGVLAVSRRPEGLAAACREVTILVTPVPAPKDCGARVFSPGALARTGTVALFRKEGLGGRRRPRLTREPPHRTRPARPDPPGRRAAWAPLRSRPCPARGLEWTPGEMRPRWWLLPACRRATSLALPLRT